MDGFVSFGIELALALRPLHLLDVLELSATAAQRWDVAIVWVHLGTLLLDESLKGRDVPCLFDFGLLLELSLFISDCVVSDPLVFALFDGLQLLLWLVPWTVPVNGVEVAPFTEPLQHRELVGCLECALIVVKFRLVAETLLLELLLIDSLVNL